MGSIVAGSTYLFAPPPKSHSHNHLIASLLCHPIAHPHLLLQLQRKDPDTRRAFPQFDLVSRKSQRRPRNDTFESSSRAFSPRLREVAVRHVETREKAATIKYIDSMTSAQKRKAGIAPDDETAIAVVYWNFARSMIKTWTVHRYESKRRGQKLGYEFRLQSAFVQGCDGGKGYVYVRWTKKLYSSTSILDRPSSTSSRTRRSNSVSSSEGPKRRHTFPSQSKHPTPSDPKWEFSSPNVRRIMASMTSQKLHIHSIASSGTPLSSPSTSDVDDEPHNDRELTTGRMFEMLIISGLFVALEEDFAFKLRKEFLLAGALRIPPSQDIHTLSDEPDPIIPTSLRSLNTPKSPVEIEPIAQIQISSSRDAQIPEPKDISVLTLKPTASIPQLTSYAARGWGYMTGTAAAGMTKLMSLVA